MKSRIVSIILTGIIAFSIVLFFYITNDTRQNFDIPVFAIRWKPLPPPKGSLQVTVVDGFNETPIKGAKIVIPETKDKYLTDANGKTPVIEVSIIEDDYFKNILKKPWGEITLLVYKEGYIEYALFHTQVWENQYRNGPKILLFPIKPNGSNDPFSIIEGPQRLWVNELVKQFR